MSNKAVGEIGERIAAKYLKKKGYTVIERNCRATFGELDIILKCDEVNLVFVEVKTFSSIGDLSPESEMTRGKITKLKRMAQFYAGQHPELIDDRGWRIDMIAVELPPLAFGQSLDTIFRDAIIRHYENI